MKLPQWLDYFLDQLAEAYKESVINNPNFPR